MVAYIEHVEEEEPDANPNEPPEIWYVVQFVDPDGRHWALGLHRRMPATWFESYPEEQEGGRRKTYKKRGGVKWRLVIIRGTKYAVKIPLETNDQGFIYLYEFEDGVRGGIVAMFKPPTNPQDGESKRQFVEE